jgi:hypothetical protein
VTPVHMLCTPHVFCGSRAKTGPEQKSAQIRGARAVLKYEIKVLKIKNAAQASHPRRIVRGSSGSPHPPLARRDDASGPSALPEGVPHLPKLAALVILRSQSATAAGADSPLPLVSGIGEEAATPGQPVRVRTRFRNVPRRFTLENHRLLQALPQSSGKLRKLSRFRCSHSPSQPRPPQQKNSPPLCENCGRKVFLVETRGKLRTCRFAGQTRASQARSLDRILDLQNPANLRFHRVDFGIASSGEVGHPSVSQT